MVNTFRKVEKLRHRKIIMPLFASGQSVVKYPFRAVFLTSLSSAFPPCEVMMTVPKKRFKRANKRNVLRRRMSEAYRLNKEVFYSQLNSLNMHLSMAIIYLPTEELDYNVIQKGMIKLLEKIVVTIKAGSSLNEVQDETATQ